MRVFITIFTVLAILFSGLNVYAFGKKNKSIAPIPTKGSEVVEDVADQTEPETVKETPEITIENNIKPEKQKKTKAVKEKKVKGKQVKEKKVKEKKQKSAKTVQTMPQMSSKQMREMQYVQDYYKSMSKNRSKLAMYLNPNLDIREVRASHILVKKRKDAVQIRKDIMSGSITFEEAAQRYSLCPSSIYGGDLGFFDRKKMEQQFSDTAFDLKIGEISKPVGTKFGWHIIKTTDKR